mmetsp:Transcript_8364/g.30928  ORF Transcript_8364/g.30928 Transcript_8364/m.30928 type:complete len:887 (-) Transcript_8364:57-2717(-)|eukprot:CAMPEP_0117444040 /NCGR_PEP_ID=MMETSP0759-20121206/5024_1 /TAXON_ID=63605 /ORGANISM="Percolomonas cosmopolitus, Strain WS" /LENGTH=886 /DNA_ID=CAMNT_0005236071 /DNA_START=128 /DNA_END=2788 /DNA_ORIENTATION=-
MSSKNNQQSLSDIDEEEMAGSARYREEGDSPAKKFQYDDDSDDEGENLFGDQYEADYEELADENNQYEDDGIDDESETPLTISDRILAEQHMRRRDEEQKMAQRMYGGSLGTDGLSSYGGTASLDENSAAALYSKRSSLAQDSDDEHSTDSDDISSQDSDEDEEEIDLIEIVEQKSLSYVKEQLTKEAVRRKIKRCFLQMLEQFTTPDLGKVPYYIHQMRSLLSNNENTLKVDYNHFVAFDSGSIYPLAILLVDVPQEVLPILNEAAFRAILKRVPEYHKITDHLFVRITNFPKVQSVRDLRQHDLNRLIKVAGVVTKRTSVYPQMKLVRFDCPQCRSVIGPIVINTSSSGKLPKPSACSNPNCSCKGPFEVNQNLTIYGNYQKITIQESPGKVPAGRIPRSKDVLLLNDLIDLVKPGEEVEITGVYRHSFDIGMNSKQGFPVFKTIIEANYIHKVSDKTASFSLTQSDTEKIHKLQREKNITKRIVKSIAPSIFGHHNIKLALALSLFGGQRKEGAHMIRGDINVLLLGDPGVAKSQFLKYVEKTANRAVYTTGKGSTAVGLTAAVTKDSLTREWVLEGGALVLADNGVCLIDEFDKMNDMDRTSIHEAMEQQTISISKAGIVTTLQARCSIIAASNPIKGRYDRSKTFKQNVALTDPILSRFDVLSVVLDDVDEDNDEKLARFVVDSHTRSHPHFSGQSNEDGEGDDDHGDSVEPLDNQRHEDFRTMSQQNMLHQDNDIIPQDLLRKFIIYQKANCHPKLSEQLNQKKLQSFYTALRAQCKKGGGLSITIRHLESMIRMAEAHARMNARNVVIDYDVDVAIHVMLETFIGTQKRSVAAQIRRSFQDFITSSKFRFSTMMAGAPPGALLVERNRGPVNSLGGVSR